MPTYNYKCIDCGHQFSAFQKMSDDPIKDCSQCEGKVRRIISGGSGMIFKGSGFYLTDYGKSGTSKKTELTSTESTIKEGGKNE
ncbi:MAG: zinc ribbon domain-containing protein [Candidatus Marinimicrobia bacterium]|nr:zinc ribbon domain-containing protein [Candidatus Neomarinimicrobiota bacterium]